MPFEINKKKWDELYLNRNAENRTHAEIDSVPDDEMWDDPELGYDVVYLLNHITDKHTSILDIGSGDGAVLGKLLMKYPYLYGLGIDGSSEAVLFALKKAKEYNIDNRCSFINQLMQKPFIFDKKFDVVISNFALQFNTSESARNVFQQISYVLADDGLFCGKMRSINRDVPNTYKQYRGEPNTYISFEDHEYGLIYHHFSLEELKSYAKILNGEIIYLHEEIEYKKYAPYEKRAWYEVVISRCHL